MENNEKYKIVFELVNKIFTDKGFTNIVLNEQLNKLSDDEKPFITKCVYGIVQNNTNLEYILSKFVDKKPQKTVHIILKMGVFMLKYLDSIPDYAVINNMSEFTKHMGKKQVSGFVNAVLRKVAITEITYPKEVVKKFHYLYSKPEWLIKKLIKQFGQDVTEDIFKFSPNTDNQIRITPNFRYFDNIVEYFDKNDIKYEKTCLNDVFYINNKHLKKLKNSDYTNQALGSVLIARALNVKGKTKVLDVCSAPAGKAIAIAQADPNCEVYACDKYPHRVNLIKKYIYKMATSNVKALECDATVFNEEFSEKFDYVLCDVPCSGFGVMFSKPDISLNRTEKDVFELVEIQKAIIENSAKYLKKGGILLYSTCTLLREENNDVVDWFLKSHPNFKTVKIELPFENYLTENNCIQFVPPYDKVDGFFMAKLVRND